MALAVAVSSVACERQKGGPLPGWPPTAPPTVPKTLRPGTTRPGPVTLPTSDTTAPPTTAPPTNAPPTTAPPTTSAPVPDTCARPTGPVSVTARTPEDFFVVTGLAGQLTNPSAGAIHVTAIYLDFVADPPGATTARLTVPTELDVPAGGEADWDWTGTVTVYPYHDDAPQPRVTGVDWTWTDTAFGASCPPPIRTAPTTKSTWAVTTNTLF